MSVREPYVQNWLKCKWKTFLYFESLYNYRRWLIARNFFYTHEQFSSPFSAATTSHLLLAFSHEYGDII